MKLISRRYYPTYNGRKNTYYSYRSFWIGNTVRKGTADYVIDENFIDTDGESGWIAGPNGNPARRLPKHLL